MFVNQEIMPYIPESEMSKAGLDLPKGIQERGYEVRTFMPKYGCINERRNQLHEVIRLSGMNLIIDDTDHPTTISSAIPEKDLKPKNRPNSTTSVAYSLCAAQ